MNILDISTLVRQVLNGIDMYSPEAQALVMGTGAVESRFEYLRQFPSGPARSWWQVEPATARDNWENYLRFRPKLWEKIRKTCVLPDDTYSKGLYSISWLLEHNIAFAVTNCRLKYWRSPNALPAADDIMGQGAIWSFIYCTSPKATIQKYVKANKILQF